MTWFRVEFRGLFMGQLQDTATYFVEEVDAVSARLRAETLARQGGLRELELVSLRAV